MNWQFCLGMHRALSEPSGSKGRPGLLEKPDLLKKHHVEYSHQEELTLRDLHLREVEEALVAHVALTATEKHLRAVLLLYAIIPARDKSQMFMNLELGCLCSRKKYVPIFKISKVNIIKSSRIRQCQNYS